MKSQNLTPSQVAAMLDVSASTVRLWSSQFADHLSEPARGGGGKRRSYTPDDLAVLQRAKIALRDGRTVPEVVVLLGASPSASGAALVTTAAIVGELNAQRAAVASLSDEVKRLREQQTTTAAQHADALGKVIADSAALADQVADLRKELDAMRSRSWWQRLFNRQ